MTAATSAAMATDGAAMAAPTTAMAAEGGNLGAGTQRHHENDTVHAKYLLRTKKGNQPTFEKTSPSPGANYLHAVFRGLEELRNWTSWRGFTCLKHRKKESSIFVRVKVTSVTRARSAPVSTTSC